MVSRLAAVFVLCTQYLVLSTKYCGFVTLTLFAVTSFGAPPKVTYLFPAGGQRGQTVSVTAAGDVSSWPVEAWVDRPGLNISAEKDKGKLKIEVAADAAAGVYWVRLFNQDGATAMRPFVVGTLPEVAENEPNDGPDKLQAVEPRLVINGKLAKSGDVDGYRIELRAGQTLVASLAANSVLGAPMDAMMQVCELVARPGSKSGEGYREADASRSPGMLEAYVVAQSHDAVGLDPQLPFTAKRDGIYLVRVFAFPATPDSSVRFAGGDDYVYRLTLTTGPFIDHCLPLTAPREEAEVQLGGWNLGSQTSAIVPPLSAGASELTPPDGQLAWVWRPEAAGAIAVPRIETVSASGSQLAIPCTVSGRLANPRQVDSYAIAAKKGEKLHIRAVAKAIGFPTDATLAVLDESGKTIAEADDTGRDDRDPQLDFTPSADGNYTITVRDLAGRGDLRMVYRLSVERATPDFSLSLAADSFILEKGKSMEVPVNVTIREGLREPIEIVAIGLPAGVTAEPVKFVPSGDAPMADAGGSRRGRRGGSSAPSAPSVKLVLKADEKAAAVGGTAIRIEGRTASESPLVRTARFSLSLPLAGQHHAAWVTVK
jgi:hypothetical protein